jgi:hypothetical protein
MCKRFAIVLPFSKMNRIPSALKGHGFSRANKCQIKILGFSPGGNVCLQILKASVGNMIPRTKLPG